MAVSEDHLLECLDVAVKAGDIPEKRRRKAMDTAAWKLLEKPWKGLLLVALDKEEVKADEVPEEDAADPPAPGIDDDPRMPRASSSP